MATYVVVSPWGCTSGYLGDLDAVDVCAKTPEEAVRKVTGIDRKTQLFTQQFDSSKKAYDVSTERVGTDAPLIALLVVKVR